MPMTVGNALSALSPTLPNKPSTSTQSGGDFGGALKQAVDALGQLSAQADASTTKLATGDPIDIHEVMLNTEQASLGFSMALQVRNKLVDAYQEVMRMSV
jgi:flagellar hook-basal body complex protein FliE